MNLIFFSDLQVYYNVDDYVNDQHQHVLQHDEYNANERDDDNDYQLHDNDGVDQHEHERYVNSDEEGRVGGGGGVSADGDDAG